MIYLLIRTTALFFLKYLRASCSTAETILFISLGFLERAVELGEDGARRLIDVIDPSQVAGVMVGNLFTFKSATFNGEFALIDELLDKLCMMDYSVVAAEFWVFVLKRIKAMWTSSDDLLDLVHVHGLDILKGHHLKDEFVACATGRVSSTGFFITKYGIFYSGMVEYLD